MPLVTPLEAAIARQRAALGRIENHAARQILRAYTVVQDRLTTDLDDLTRQIEQARAAGVEVRPVWLFAQHRYHTLIQDLERHTADFLANTLEHVTGAQREAVRRAIRDGRDLVKAALGPAPQRAEARIAAVFTRMPVQALDRLVGIATDGQPLGQLLAEITPATSQRVKDALAYGVASGKQPRVIAREVHTQAGVARNRALVICRTEMIRAHREAVTDTWQQSGIVTSWRWVAKLDTRTCAACWAQHGTEHPIDQPMATHPNCRCAKAPVTPSWADLGFDGIPDQRPQIEPGPEAFARLPETEQLAILGRAKLDAYNAGRITLDDLIHRTHSHRWGTGSREATLTEALT